MAQTPKFIDITRSYVPVDPNTFPQNLIGTAREDAPEDAVPIVPYEGWNFLPTAHGYKSYFGINRELEIEALTSRVDKVLIYQSATFNNILVALCEDGIWTKQGDELGEWYHAVVLDVPAEGSHEDWTYAILSNDLFMYRAGEPAYWRIFAGLVEGSLLASMVEAPVAGPAIAVLASGSNMTNGVYTFRLAYKNAAGLYSLASPATSSPAIVNSQSIELTWPTITEAVLYRLYWEIAGTTYYKDIRPMVGATQIYYFMSPSSLGTLDAFPDTTWVTNSDIAQNQPVAITPTFLNMEGQRGMFSAGTRLGFWDSENSISWSSIDDYAEFTPSIQTLAGSAIFSAVVGRIVNILPHGEGFVIYAVQSIVHVRKNVEATFQWDPNLLLNGGISYPRQAVAGISNQMHFAYTDTGIYTIEEGRGKFIIPELYDFLKEMALPIYLDMLEGRYLIVEIMDADFITGAVQFRVNTVPAQTITFPGSIAVSDLGDPITLEGSAACYSLQGLDTVHTNGGASAVNGEGFEFGPLWRSYYTSYFSLGHAPTNITWGATPCATLDVNNVELNFNPLEGKVSNATQDSTNKVSITNPPGEMRRITTDSFVAIQLALWAAADENRSAFLAAILSKTYTGESVISQINGDIPPSGYSTGYAVGINGYCPMGGLPITGIPTISDCEIGDYILEMSAPIWGWSECGLYLTRYVTKKATLVRRTTVRRICVSEAFPNSQYAGWHDVVNISGPTGYGHATPNDVINARVAQDFPSPPSSPVLGQYYEPLSEFHGQGWVTFHTTYTPITTIYYYIPGVTKTIDVTSHRLVFTDEQDGVFGADTAYMELAGWYDSSDPTKTVARGISCAPPVVDMPTEAPRGSSIPISPLDGNICGIPFDPITLPALSDDPIEWPAQSVTLPSGSFLLQDGSIAPIYPTFYGAYVFDTHLKKWGKMRHEYKALLNYLPINGQSGDNVPFSTFGIRAGLMNSAGMIRIFDAAPTDSYITWGKIGYNRKGFTDCEEVRIQFATPSTCKLAVETSIDGRFVELALTKYELINDAMAGTLLAGMSGRWYNVRVSGQYDISYLEFRGHSTGRR